MGDRTIELTITDGYDDDEDARAGRLYVFEKILPGQGLKPRDREYDSFMFHAHNWRGDDYVVAIRNEAAGDVWAILWEQGYVNITIDQGFAMRAIPPLPPESDEKPIAPEIP